MKYVINNWLKRKDIILLLKSRIEKRFARIIK